MSNFISTNNNDGGDGGVFNINSTISPQVENQSSSESLINLDSNINEMSQEMSNITLTNQGTGAGGANTNASGLPFESSTDLSTEFDDEKTIYHQYHKQINFKNTTRNLVSTNQSVFFKYMKDKMNNDITHAHGCKKPDECYIDEENKNIFIIEKKNQNVSGSVCEKIQTSDFKKWQYGRLFPQYNIIYIYCLSDWFKTSCVAEIEYLNANNVPVFWGNSENYKQDIINFIVNYVQ